MVVRIYFSLIKMVCKLHSHGGSWENITLLVLGKGFLESSDIQTHQNGGEERWRQTDDGSKLGRT